MKIFIGYVLLLFFLLLQPFDFSLPYQYRKIQDSNGTVFTSRGEFFASSLPNRLYNDLVSGTGLTLEVWATIIKNQPDDAVARIVSYSGGHGGARNFTLAQKRGDVFMVLRDMTNLKINNIAATDQSQHIVFTYNFSEEKVYIDGHISQHKSAPGKNFTHWDPSYTLVVGNEVTGDKPWNGQLAVLAIYNRALSGQEIRNNHTAGRIFDADSGLIPGRTQEGLVALYGFSQEGAEEIPDRSGNTPPIDLQLQIPIHQELLLSPFRELSHMPYHRFAIDMIGNIILFIPFGFLFHSALTKQYPPSWKIALYVVILGTLFTFCIETLQYFLLTRHSSLTDVFNNVLGTTLGVIINATGLIKSCKRQA